MKAMHENQRVADMAVEVLARQASARAERTGEPFEVALKAVRETEAGRQLEDLVEECRGKDERVQFFENLFGGGWTVDSAETPSRMLTLEVEAAA